MNFDAKCAECGKSCTVPFKPLANRPIYCKECYSKRRNQPHPMTTSSDNESHMWARRAGNTNNQTKNGTERKEHFHWSLSTT